MTKQHPKNEADDDFLQQSESTIRDAHDLAVRHMMLFAPFDKLPEQVTAIMLPDFARLAATNALSREDMQLLLTRNVPWYLYRLRLKLFTQPALGPVRLCALVHVAVVIGWPLIEAQRDLWDAIDNARWDDAADALQLTRWPELATTESEKRRVLDIARMMRTGEPPAQVLAA